MNINFPPVDDKYIKSQINAGYYSNATELVRDAVRRLREQKQERHPARTAQDRLLAALQIGIDDAEAGRVVVYDKNFMKNTLKKVEQIAAAGGPFDLDVVGPDGQEPW